MKEKDSDKHAKKFPSNPRKSRDDCASIEYSKKKQQESSPNTDPDVKEKKKKLHENNRGVADWWKIETQIQLDKYNCRNAAYECQKNVCT